MLITTFLQKQEPDRQLILTQLHEIIVSADATVEPEVGTMMGKEMILYKNRGVFKYGLASVKNYMSMHAMPIYCSPELHSKYEKLLDKASFQKGCINFKTPDAMPSDLVKQFIDECSKVDLLAIMQELKRNR